MNIEDLNLRQEPRIQNDFCDVDLACGDSKIGAHKLKVEKQLGQKQSIKIEKNFCDRTLSCDDKNEDKMTLILKRLTTKDVAILDFLVMRKVAFRMLFIGFGEIT